MPDLDDYNRKPPTPLRRARFLLEHLLLSGWTVGLRLLPRPAAIFWGTVLGSGAYVLLRGDRRVAMANLDLVFGDRRSIWFKRELALGAFQRAGEVMMGLLWSPRLDRRSALSLVDTREIARLVADLDRQRRGTIMVTFHYGDWEMACIACGFAGISVTSVAEPWANQRLDRLFTACRAVSGNGIIAPKYALLKLMRLLRAGGRVALLCDVNGRRGRGGVWNDFFGRKVYNSGAVGEMALRTGAAVVFVAVEPTKDGRHRIVPTLIEPGTAEKGADRAAAVAHVMQTLTDLVAENVRKNPRPWLWTYKRWKRRPTPAQDNYPSYSNHKRVE